MVLTCTERQILYNQYQILSLLCPEESKYFELKMKILSNGYTSEYGDVVNFENEIPEEDCDFVYDVLSMYRDLYFSFDKLDEKSNISKDDVVFRGFDGNNECKYYVFASFLLKEKDIFNEFADVGVNSHASRIDMYKKMLAVYKPILDDKIGKYREYLTKGEILSIINAWRIKQ